MVFALFSYGFSSDVPITRRDLPRNQAPTSLRWDLPEPRGSALSVATGGVRLSGTHDYYPLVI